MTGGRVGGRDEVETGEPRKMNLGSWFIGIFSSEDQDGKTDR